MLRSAEVNQLILRTAKVNYRLNLKTQDEEIALRRSSTSQCTVRTENAESSKYDALLQKFSKEKTGRDKAEAEIKRMQQVIQEQTIMLNKFKQEALEQYYNSSKSKKSGGGNSNSRKVKI